MDSRRWTVEDQSRVADCIQQMLVDPKGGKKIPLGAASMALAT